MTNLLTITLLNFQNRLVYIMSQSAKKRNRTLQNEKKSQNNVHSNKSKLKYAQHYDTSTGKSSPTKSAGSYSSKHNHNSASKQKTVRKTCTSGDDINKSTKKSQKPGKSTGAHTSVWRSVGSTVEYKILSGLTNVTESKQSSISCRCKFKVNF